MKLLLIGIILFTASNAYALYDQDWLVYDSKGLKSVNCVRCNKVVKKRGEILIITPSGDKEYVIALKRLAHCVELEFQLNDGSRITALMDKDCVKDYTGTIPGKRNVMKQLRRGYELEAIAANMDAADIARIKARVNRLSIAKPYNRRRKNREKVD